MILLLAGGLSQVRCAHSVEEGRRPSTLEDWAEAASTPTHDPFNPTSWNEWLLPVEEYTMAEPQGASCRIFVREVGEGDPIVVLHGGWGGEHMSMLRGLMPLGKSRRLVFYDQRGSLRSPCDRPPEVTDHIADLERLRQTIGEERIVLLGHSMGGWLAQAYASAHPDRVAGMILVGTVPARHDLPWRSDEIRWERPEVLAELKRHGLVLPRRPEDSIQGWSINHRIIFAAVNLHDVTRWREIPVPWFYQPAAAASSAESMPNDYDFIEDLKALPIPILVLAGDDDYIPIDSHRAWVPQVPNARLVVVENAGHFAWIDRSEVVFDTIRAYLED